MGKEPARWNKLASRAFVCGLLLLPTSTLPAAERIYSAYFSPAPGASAVIWVAKEARLFDKHGLDVAPVLIPSSVRTLQAILAAQEGSRSNKFLWPHQRRNAPLQHVCDQERAPSPRARVPRLPAPVLPGAMSWRLPAVSTSSLTILSRCRASRGPKS